jgi:hypothetical protein
MLVLPTRPSVTTLRDIDPVCAHHGKRWSEHEGGRCLFCCICATVLTPEQCAVDEEGVKWDTCKGDCARDAGIIEAAA